MAERALRTLLGYHSLISGSYRPSWSVRPSLASRFFSKGHSTTTQTTTNEYFCINLISSRAFSGSKEGRKDGRIRSVGGSIDRTTFLYKNQIIGKEGKEDTGDLKQRSQLALQTKDSFRVLAVIAKIDNHRTQKPNCGTSP